MRPSARVRALCAMVLVSLVAGRASAQAPTPSSPPAPSGAAAPATAAVQEEARTHFARGVQLYREGSYAAALVEFRRAYGILPSNRILYNEGEAFYQLQDYAGALDAFEKYLAGGGDIPAERRAAVEADIKTLRTRVAALRITTNVPGADIAIDDVPIGRTPLSSDVQVSAGRRRITATLAGRPPVAQAIEVAGGDVSTVTLVFQDAVSAPAALAPPPTVRPPEPPPPSVATHSRTPVWIGLGVTGGLVAATAVFGILTLEANQRFESKLGAFPGVPADIASARSSVHTFGVVTDVLVGATAVVAGATLYFALQKHGTSADLRAAVGPGRVALEGTF